MAITLKNLFKSGPKSVIGVDIGPSSIKVVQLTKKKGKAVLETYGSIALGPYAGIEVGRATHLTPEKIAVALNDVLRESNVTSRAAGVSVPMSSSLVNVIEIPTPDPKQIEQIIPIEARKYIPVPITEVALDWSIIPKEETNTSAFQQEEEPTDPNAPKPRKIQTSEVLLVVIHNEALSHLQSVVNTVGLETSFFEIEIFSTMRSVLANETNPVMIFDMGASATKLYIIDRGILRTSHVITRGSQDLTLSLAKATSLGLEEAEVLKRTKGLTIGTEHHEIAGVMASALNYIFAETNRVMTGYQRKANKKIEKIILTGGGAAMVGLLEIAKGTFQTEVTIADPFNKVEAPVFLAPKLKEVGPEFAVALGLALRKLQDIE